MIRLEVVGSRASPRADLLGRLGLLDGSREGGGRMGSPSPLFPPPPSRLPPAVSREASTMSREVSTMSREPSIVRVPPAVAVAVGVGERGQKKGGLSGSRRAVQKAASQHHQQHNVPLPEAAHEDLPSDYVATVTRAIVSYDGYPESSGRSSPANMEAGSSLAVSQGGWTTGNTTERSSAESSCYSLDEFDRQAASTVNQHFEEFESMLFEGPRETASNAYRECQEWVTQFPHLRLLGQQLVAPTDMGYTFIASDSSSGTHRPSTSGTLAPSLAEQEPSASSEGQGLMLSGHEVKAVRAPTESGSAASRHSQGQGQGQGQASSHDSNHSSSDFSFLHEEIFAQDGVYEDIIAMDYKNSYEDNTEHKKQIPRRRHLGYPPITPNASVKDSVLSAAFDKMWSEIMSWLRSLLRRYCLEVEGKKGAGALGHVMAPQRPLRASSFVLSPRETQEGMLPLLQVSKMALRDRNSHSLSATDMGESALLGESSQQTAAPRPSTMPHPHPRRRLSHNQHLDPLREPAKVPSAGQEESGALQPSPQNALRVKQIVPSAAHRLSSPPTSIPGRLPPLESSSGIPSQRRLGHRASSAVDNKEGRKSGGRERNNSSSEFSRPSTTQDVRSDSTFGAHALHPSTPMAQSIPGRQLYTMGGMGGGLNVMGNGLYPSVEPGSTALDDHEGPSVDRHNQWIPSTPSFSFFKPRRTLRN